MTIFGFNTDIRHGDTVFHVQTEARESELSMQSAIFVRGRCIGKHTVSYAHQARQPEFDEHLVHQLVTQQHRLVVNTIREGRLKALLSNEAAAAPVPAPTDQAGPATTIAPESDSLPGACPAAFADGPDPLQPKLAVEWLSDGLVWRAGNAHMRFRLTLGERPSEGVRLMTRLDCAGCEPIYAEAISDCQGEAELVFRIEKDARGPSVGCTVLVKAMAGSQSVTRKFRLQRH